MSKGKGSGTITRLSFEALGINKGRYRELKKSCRKGIYDRETLLRACDGFPEGVAAFVIKSVTEGRTFERIEFDSELGRISVCRTNFYALRRQFYGNLDKALKERGAGRETI